MPVTSYKTYTFSTITNNTTSGYQPWVNPDNAKTSNGQYATCFVNSNPQSSPISNYLMCLGPVGDPIPSNAEISGVQIDILCKESQGGLIRDNSIYLVINNQIKTSANRAEVMFWPETNQIRGHGGSTDLWGLVLTPSQLLSPSSGVAIQISADSSRPPNATAYIDQVTMTVWYTIHDIDFTFTSSVVSGAVPLNVAFTTTVQSGTPPYTYSFDPGDGSAPVTGTPIPTHTYSSIGIYTAKMTVTDSTGRTGEQSIRITATKQNPGTFSILFSGSPLTGYAPLSVSYSSSCSFGTPPYTEIIDFGDGTSVTYVTDGTVTGYHIYTNPGTYEIREVAIDSVGNVGIATPEYTTVIVNQGNLDFEISVSPDTGPAPLGVNFQTVSVTGSGYYEYLWQFGDGSQGNTSPNCSHVYISPGTYTASLQVRDVYTSTTRVKTHQITVFQAGQFYATIQSDVTTGPSPLTVHFTSTVSGGNPPYTYDWDLGDTNHSSDQNPVHQYTAIGTFQVRLSVSDSSSPPLSVQSNTLNITVTSSGGGGGLLVNTSVLPTTGPAPLTVGASGYVSGGVPPYSYLWSFGDGTPDSPNQNTSHVYTTPGTYNCRLKVTDTANTTVFSAPTVITVTASGQPPGSTGDATLKWVGHDDRTPDADILYAYYLFPTESNYGPWNHDTQKTYTNLPYGTYTFYVKAKDNAGQESTPATWTFTVGSSGTMTAWFYEDIHSSPTYPVTVTVSGYAEGGTPPYNFIWDFGDTTPTQTGSVTAHTYTASGAFTVTMTATDAAGGSITKTDVKYIGGTAPLQAWFTEDIHSSSTVPVDVTFSASGSGGTPPYTFTWDFGDTSPTVTGDQVTHTYTTSGTFTVTMTAQDSVGAIVTKTDTKYMTTQPPQSHTISGTITFNGIDKFTIYNNNSSYGYVPWSYRYNAAVTDGLGASVTLTGPAPKSNLLVLKWPVGTNIPPGTPITGVELHLRVLADVSGGVTTNLRHIKNGVIHDPVQYPDHTWSASGWEWITYGGPTDLIGLGSLTSDDIRTKEYGIGVIAARVPGIGTPVTAQIDSAYIIFYYSGRPTYPIGVSGINVELYDRFNGSDTPIAVGTTDTNGNYTIHNVPDGYYVLDPEYDPSSQVSEWQMLSPPYLTPTVSGANLVNQDFTSEPVPLVYVKKNTTIPRHLSMNASPAGTWFYFWFKSRGNNLVTVKVTPVNGDTLYIYLRRDSLPETPDDYDLKDDSAGGGVKRIQFHPATIAPGTGSVRNWFVGVFAQPAQPKTIPFDVTVTQPQT